MVLACRAGGDADEGDEGEEGRQEGHVHGLPLGADARVPAEVGLVDAERGVVADDRGHGGEKGPAIGRPGHTGLLVEDLVVVGRPQTPAHDGDPRGRHDQRLGHEQPAQLVRVHDQEGHLRKPEEEEADHGGRVDALALGDVVRQRQERGPDGPDHHPDRVGTVHGLDGEPEDGEDGAGDDGDVAAPEAPAGPRDHREGDVMEDTDGAVERDHPRDDEEAQGDDAQTLAPGQPDGDDASGKLPRRRVERVRDPVGDEAGDTPFASLWWHGVEIFVGPAVAVSLWTGPRRVAYHREFPSANTDCGCSTLR